MQMYKCVGSGAATGVKRKHVGGNMSMKSNSDEKLFPHSKVGPYSWDMGRI